MNEVTKIHLGREAYTISVEAHKELRNYLDAIKKQVGDKDVVEEVELRMSELLAEHGISGAKVILPADVDFLKEQLGNPKDFKEDDEPAKPADKPGEVKRLFRDTDNAMIAGVAAGLASYFGVDVLLVRLIFVTGVFTGGWGILLYVALWLLVPEAKTSSERLQMAGKSVTVDSLKEAVERADVRGAASRANKSIAGPVNSFFRLTVKIIGIGFILVGLSMLLGLVAAATYVQLHSGSIGKDSIFPIGFREHLLLDTAMIVAGLISVFIVLFGMAIFRRKWPIRSWITGMLIGLILIGVAAGGVLAADTVPQVRDRYNANVHTTTRYTQPFNYVSATGDGMTITYEPSVKYSVTLKYYGDPNLSNIKTTVSDGTLYIDSRQFAWHRSCETTLCLPPDYQMTITVNSPSVPRVNFPDGPGIFTVPGPQKIYSQ